MTSQDKSKSAAPMTRVLALGIDLVIAFVPTALVQLGQQRGSGALISPFVGFVLLFWVHTTIFLMLSRSGTVGDFFMHLNVADLEGNPCSRPKLLSRNLVMTIMMATPVMDTSDVLFTTVSFLGVIGAGLMMFSKSNRYNQRMAIIDFMFKTLVVPKSQVQ